ncbi:HAD-IA family hydrolase [bacterium]|nr:HAD-IA family hydrolase [bacterium]
MVNLVFDFYGVIYTPSSRSVDIELVSYINELKEKGYSLYIFSNTSTGTITKYDNSFHFLHFFDSIIPTEHAQKPSRDAFDTLFYKLNVRPEEIILIDDGQANIDMANSLDMVGVLYTDLDSLKEDLDKILSSKK